MPDDILIGRIRKLLALGKEGSGATEAEAASALAKASELLLAHGLAMADIDQKGNTTQLSGASRIRESKIDFGTSPFSWKKSLVQAVTEHNFCRIYVVHTDRGKVQGITLIGAPSNIEITVMLTEWLFRQIKSLASSTYKVYNSNPLNPHVDPLRWHTSFAQGATNRLRERLTELRYRQMAEHSAGITSIVVSLESDIRDYEEEKFPWKKEQRLAREAWTEKMNLEREAQKEWDAAHPTEAAAREAKRAEEREQWEAEYAEQVRKRRQKDEAYYRRTGHYPGEGRPQAQPKTKVVSGTAYNQGLKRADDINLQPYLEEKGTTAPPLAEPAARR